MTELFDFINGYGAIGWLAAGVAGILLVLCAGYCLVMLVITAIKLVFSCMRVSWTLLLIVPPVGLILAYALWTAKEKEKIHTEEAIEMIEAGKAPKAIIIAE